MSSYESIPLTLKTGAGDGSVQQSDNALEEWMAYHAAQGLTLEYPTVNDRYNKSLTLDPTNADLIGTYVDTFYNEPVGTHPGTSISQGTISTNLYQMEDSATPTRFRSAYSIPVVTDNDGDIYEMSDNGIFELAQRIAGQVHVNQFFGAFRLSKTSPGQGWFKWINQAFTDTRTSGDVHYHIWRLDREVGNNNEPTVPDHFPLTLKDGVSPDLREITKEEAKEIAREILLIGQASTGVGDYELRSSAQGAPTASGTWVARGTALDTKHVVAPRQYTSRKFTSPQFSRQYTGQYIGQYTGISFANVDVQYAGVRTFTFQGSRNYQGNYQGSRNYSGSYAGDRSYGGKYAGNRYFSGQRNFSGNRPFSKQYARIIKFAGLRPVTYYVKSSYSGSRQKDRTFAGVRAIGYSGDYAGVRTTPFSGIRWKPGGYQPWGGYASITYYSTTYSERDQYFGGRRQFSAAYTRYATFTGVARQFQGKTRQPISFERPITTNWSGERKSYWSGERESNWGGPRVTYQVFFTPDPPPPDPDTVFYRFIFNPPPNIDQADAGGDNSFAELTGVSQQGRETQVVSRVTYGVFSRVTYGDFTRVTYGDFASYTTKYYTGQRDKIYAGPIYFQGERYYQGVRYYTGNYGGPRSFTGKSYVTYYYPYPYQGYRLYDYSGDFGGPFPYPFQGVRYKNVNQNFGGQRSFSNNYVRNQVFYVDVPAQYSGPRKFAGVRYKPIPAGFVRPYRGFVRSSQFQGSRTYGKQYQGSRNYQGNYQGSRNYSGSYAGPRGNQFTGQVRKTYTAQYTGTYTGVYAGNYTSQYSNQYTGQTITSQIQTIETYTLYCRIAD